MQKESLEKRKLLTVLGGAERKKRRRVVGSRRSRNKLKTKGSGVFGLRVKKKRRK